ncbi:MAG: MFS transporter [Bacteroidia bacterium]
MSATDATKKPAFTGYEKFIIAVLAFIQFTVVLDFMVLSPLGAILIKEMRLSPGQFSTVVSAYAISAGIAGLLTAGFADKYDRRKILLFFYTGFLLGTVFCALSPDFYTLFAARIFTGLFGGVIASVSFAIITDLFEMHLRGRVMGFVQMSFAASQVLGLPIGLWLANHYGWHSPFWMIAAVGLVAGIVMFTKMKPVNAHLKEGVKQNAFLHLKHTVSQKNYLRGFLATTLLATGGFMLMPFGSDFTTNNLGLTLEQLPYIYAITGVFTIIVGPLAGRLSDKIGKYKLFFIASLITMTFCIIYTNLEMAGFWVVAIVNTVMMVAVTARLISASALITAVPAAPDRGAFMSINSSVQQISGGIASIIAGLIVAKDPKTQMLLHYPVLGYVVSASMIVALLLYFRVDKMVKAQLQKDTSAQPVEAEQH